jgi:hypothetical protein
MIGIDVARRTNANTTSASVHPTTRSGVPVKRSEARSTAKIAVWLTTSAAASAGPRDGRNRSTRDRKEVAAAPQSGAGGRRNRRRKGDAAAPASAPARRAKASLRSTRASTPNAPRNTPIPTRAGSSSSARAPPVAASSPSATAGSRSLNDMFATKVARADSATWAGENPHDRYMV